MTEKAYEIAKEKYAKIGVDTDAAIKKADEISVSLHCWQCDDVIGFENTGGALTGGIQTTGDYPGRATTPDEVRRDMDKAFSYVPGKKKANIHAIYIDTDHAVDRNGIEPQHFSSWADWAAERGYGLDFNPTFFSHPKSGSYSLSSYDKDIRDFWVEHGKRAEKIAEYFGERTGQLALNNIWVHDGEKEFPIDTATHRHYLRESLDRILDSAKGSKCHLSSVESKLFGIGSESYVVGSHEFYMGYALTRDDVALTLDTGHFHPTELVSAKLSAILEFKDKVLLHVSRPVRWDSDHVVAFDDETRAIMREIARLDAFDRVYIATDYFDASVNRIMALAVGARNTRKAILEAMLQPVDTLKKLERGGDTGSRLALCEELKTMPIGDVWDYYCEKNGVLTGVDWIADAKKYEDEVLSKR